MDQGRHRRGTFHRIGQPHVQRDLRALAERPEHQQVWNRLDRPAAGFGAVTSALERLKQRAVFDRPEVMPDQIDRQRQPEVADAVDDERFLRRRHRRRFAVVVADQPIRREAHALPTQIQHQQVVGHHQRGHSEQEHTDAREEPRVAAPDIGLHIFARVQGDQRAQPRHEQHPQQRQRIDVQREVRNERPAVAAQHEPIQQVNHNRLVVPQPQRQGHQER